MAAAATIRGLFDSIVDYAQRRPGIVLAWVLGFHLVVWTLVPALVSWNLQLDLVEDLALGKEWQLGYWKHPPLPWWIADLVYRLTGQIDAIYVLGPLAAVVCLYAVWLLGREVVGETKALIAVVALEAVHYYNFSVVKFAHDQMQLPFWALTGLFFWRAIVRGRLFDWMLAGLFLAGAFWSKYAVFALAATLGLILLIDPFARRAWRAPGPYMMALVFLVVIAPNVWWLINNDFMPLHYVDDRAAPARHWYDYVLFPLRWSGGQFLYLLPALILLALLYWRRHGKQAPVAAAPSSAHSRGGGNPESSLVSPGSPLSRGRAGESEPTQAANALDEAAFNRRYVAALALGPFAVTTIIALVLGRQPIALWGYPLWSFVPLAVLMWWPPALDVAQLRRFAAGALAVLIAFPLGFAIAELGEPFIRDRSKATQFPGALLAELITREWRERTGTPLKYVGGAIVINQEWWGPRRLPGAGQFAANNVAVYSPDRPHVIVEGELAISPWINATDLERHGAVLLWQPNEEGLPENIRRAFPHAELQPPLTVPRHTLYPRRGELIYYAFVLPRALAQHSVASPVPSRNEPSVAK